MKKSILSIIIFLISFGLNAQDETVNGILSVNKNVSQIETPFSLLKLKTIDGVYDGTNGPAIEFSTNIGLAKIAGVDERTDNNSMYQGGLIFKTRLHNLGNDFGFYERMRICANGNIGIGISSPNAKLHLKNELGNAILIIQGKQDQNVGNNAELILSTEYSTANNMSGSQTGRKSLIRATAGGAWGTKVRLGFFTSTNDSSYPEERMVVSSNGNIGIGTTAPSHELDVKGTIHATEVIVDLNVEGPDYVFEPEYNLKSLSELDQFLKTNKHLPEVPSAAQMKEEGVNMVEMQMLLLKKVEELTLHIIKMEKDKNDQISALQMEIDSLRN